ncbi:hypothetical protein GCM10009794_07280 [Rothia terrae]
MPGRFRGVERTTDMGCGAIDKLLGAFSRYDVPKARAVARLKTCYSAHEHFYSLD